MQQNTSKVLDVAWKLSNSFLKIYPKEIIIKMNKELITKKCPSQHCHNREKQKKSKWKKKFYPQKY